MLYMVAMIAGFILAKLDTKYGACIGYKLGIKARAAIAKAKGE